MKQDKGETHAITIRIPVLDHNALAALAEREERSVGAQVRFAIKMMLRASEPQAQESPADDPATTTRRSRRA